jgi:hypothetical protein
VNPTICKAVIRTARDKHTIFFPPGTEFNDAVRLRLYERCTDPVTTITSFVQVPRVLEAVKMSFVLTKGDSL